MTRMVLRNGRLLIAWALLASVGCDTQPLPTSRDAGPSFGDCGPWRCPTGWVSSPSGGCGPALILCADGGALPSECDDVPRVDPEGDAGGWRLAPSGVRGPWPEDDDPSSGVPQANWSPADLPSATLTPDTALTCAAGWQRQLNGLCDPRLGSCASGSMPLPGGRCTPDVAASCTDDRSPAALGVPSGAAVRWVHAAASSAVPDGTYERPYASLADALRDAPDGVWLLLRNGSYAGGLAVPRSAHVVAACRHRAVVTAAAERDAAFTVRAGATLDLRDVAVRGDTDGVVVDDGGALTAAGVLFDGLPRHAVLAPTAASAVRLEGCVVSGVAAGMPVADEGAVLVGGRAFVTGSHFTRLGVAALRANGPAASTTIQDSAFLDTASIAVDIVGGATARLTRLAFSRNGYAAWSAANATVEASDLSIADVTPGPSGITRGVFIGGSSTARIRGLSVRNATMTGVFIDGRSAVFVERAAFVGSRFVRCRRSTQGTSECSLRVTDWQDEPSGDLIGASIQARGGASLSVRNASFTDGEGMAIHVENSVADVEAVRVERYAGQREGARGLHAGGAIAVYADERAGAASLTLRGSLLANNTHYGLIAYAPGTSVVVRDSVIRDGHTPAWPGALGVGGGAAARRGATLRIIRSRAVRNEIYNVMAGEAGVASLEGSSFDEGRAGLGVGNGSGAIAQQAQVYALRCVFAGNQRAGVTALLGGRMRLERCVIRDTVPHPDEVAATLPEDRVARAGVGAYAWLDGHIELVESRVTANRGLGVGALGRAAGASLLRTIIVDQQGPPELPARGVEAAGGGEVRLDACLLSNNEQISLNATGRDSRLSVVDSAVRGTRTHEATASGFGVQVFGGARAYFARVWINDSTRVGLTAAGAGTRVELDDVTIAGVRSTVLTSREANQGIGVFVGEGAALHADRLSVVDTGGAAVAVSSEGEPAWLDARDLFARDVRRAQVRTVAPTGGPVAYGLHVAGHGTLVTRRAMVEGADFGFARIGGTLDVEGAVFARVRVGGGSSTGRAPDDLFRLASACAPGAPRADVVADETLPSALVGTELSGCALPPCEASEGDP